MAKVRLAPSIQDPGEVKEEFRSSVASPVRSGLLDMGEALEDVYNVGIRYNEAKKSNSFSTYKDELSLVQKDYYQQMSLSPDAEKRKQIGEKGRQRSLEVANRYDYKDDDDIKNYTETWLKGYEIGARGLYGKLELNDQRELLQDSIENTVDSNLPKELKLREGLASIEKNTGTVISSQEAEAMKVVLNETIERDFLTKDPRNMYSTVNIDSAIATSDVSSPENLKRAESGINIMYSEAQTLAMGSTLPDKEKQDRVDNLKMAQSKLTQQLRSAYVNTQTIVYSDAIDMIDATYDSGNVTNTEQGPISLLIDGIEDPSTKERVNRYNAKRQGEVSKKIDMVYKNDKATASSQVNFFKTAIVSGGVTSNVVMERIERLLFKTDSKGNMLPNKKVSAGEFEVYSKYYQILKNGTDYATNTSKGIVSDLKSDKVIPSMSGKEVDEVAEELADKVGKDYEDLDQAEQLKFRKEATDVNRRLSIYISRDLQANINTFITRNKKEPNEIELLELTDKAVRSGKASAFVKDSLSKKTKKRTATKPKSRPVKRTTWEDPYSSYPYL